RGAAREARRAPCLRRGGGTALRAPPAQPAQRGPRPGDDAAAPRARGVAARGPGGRRAARRGGGAADRPGERGEPDPRPRRDRDARGGALRRAVALLAATLALSACGSSNEPPPLARTATATPSPTATPKPLRDVPRA